MQLLQYIHNLHNGIYTVEDRSVNSCGLQGSMSVRRDVASEKVRTVVVVSRREIGSAAWKGAGNNGSQAPPARHDAHSGASN